MLLEFSPSKASKATSTLIRRWKSGHRALIISMAFDSGRNFLATGSADSSIRCWDVDRNICTHKFNGHRSLITTLSFHPTVNNLTLFSGSDDGSVREWDLLEKACTGIFDGHSSAVRGIQITPCGKFLISAGRDEILNVWSVTTKKLIKSISVMEV